MKQARSILLVFAPVLLVACAFWFGLHVRNSIGAAALLSRRGINTADWSREAQAGTGASLLPAAAAGTPVRVADSDSSSAGSQDFFNSDSPFVTFEQVYELLKNQYVEGIPSDTPLAHGAVSAMVASLDEPNSRFLEPAERVALEQQASGVFPGTGIVYTVRKHTTDGLVEREVTVMDAVPGSPAAKAGLRTDDVVTEIDGRWIIGYDPFAAQAKMFKSLAHDEVSLNHAVDAVEAKVKDGLTLAQAQAMLNTTRTQPMILTVERTGAPFKVTLDVSTPTTVTDIASRTMPDGNGYIHIAAFDDKTGSDFSDAVASLASAPGIVIDLRDCPGGEIDPAVAIGQSLAPGVSFASVTVRDNKRAKDKFAGFGVHVEQIGLSSPKEPSAPASHYKGNLVVLVDKGTANSAELLAAFLHDRLGARIVGSSTFGDALAQTLFPMSDGSGFTLTTGIITTDMGQTFEAKGITPDVVLADSDLDGQAAVDKADSLLALKPLTARIGSPSSTASAPKPTGTF